jgi:ABC-type ATPase involved in cell division/cell division protein FtsX
VDWKGVGYRPVATDGARALKNGEAANGKRARTNGATSHRPSIVNAVVETPVVRLSRVTKSFGRTRVLTDVNFTVAPGELVEVTGPSGSGKTTLLRLIHGQLRPNGGEVWVDGRGLHRWWRRGLGRIRRDVAFIFQEQRLLPRLTAHENVMLAMQVRDPQVPRRTVAQRALAALESLSLGHKRRAYPHQLSAGERQRVAVARALATRPRILLADEPLSSIDEDNARVVMRLLEEAAANGATVIVATHQHTFHSSRMLRLPTGNVLLNGSRKRAANGTHAPASLWRMLIPIAERPRKPAPRTSRLPLSRRLAALSSNSFELVVWSGLRSWSRDLRLVAPALGSIALLLTLCGTLALIGLGIDRVATQQASQASIVRVYLAPGASNDAVASLKARLLADSRVTSVTNISPEQALAEASGRPGLDSLASLSSANPFPASLDVRVRDVTAVGAMAMSVYGDPAVDPAYPTSYDPNTYSRLRRFALIAGAIGGGLLLLFGIVAYAVAANSMRGIAAARRQEVVVTRLLGARGWMLRGPFVVEGLMTGAVAGALAAAAVTGAWWLAINFESATYAQVLPGVGPASVQYAVAAVIVAGLVLGTLTSMLGFRRIRA